MIGQMQMLDKRRLVEHWKAKGLDFSQLFHKPDAPEGVAIHHSEPQDHQIDDILDRKLIAQAQAALDRGEPVRIEATIRNIDRTAGAMLSGEVAKRYGHAGLPDDTIHVQLNGTAGQSFGAWLARGVTFELEGEANDYVGKGLSGGRIIIRPPADAGDRAGRIDHRRQHGAVRRDRRRMLFPRRRRRALRGAQFRRHRGGRGRGRPWLRIHDRRHRGRARQDRPQFRGRHVGRHRLCARRGRHVRTRCNMAMVELEPVPEEEDVERAHHHAAGDLEVHGRVDVMSDMTRFDAERLHQLIANHARYTGSAARADNPRRLERLSAEVPQGDAGRVPPRAGRDGAVAGSGGGESAASWPSDRVSNGSWMRKAGTMGKTNGQGYGLPGNRPAATATTRRSPIAFATTANSCMPLPEEATRDQAARCMDCGIPVSATPAVR